MQLGHRREMNPALLDEVLVVHHSEFVVVVLLEHVRANKRFSGRQEKDRNESVVLVLQSEVF